MILVPNEITGSRNPTVSYRARDCSKLPCLVQDRHVARKARSVEAPKKNTLTHPDTRDALPLGTAYRYDQLNRLKEALSYNNLSGRTWGSGMAGSPMYRNDFHYDANGNITNQHRYDESGNAIDDMDYEYNHDVNGKKINNRLRHVSDNVDYDAEDINPGMVTDNYQYDAEGRLIADAQEQIDKIIWRVDGKVREIQRPASSGRDNLRFDYDAMGRRIAKHVYDDNWSLKQSTYYALDAQGNTMSVYEYVVKDKVVSFSQEEKHIYGSSRLGIMNESVYLLGSVLHEEDMSSHSHVIGQRTYELSNHLGNVLAVVSDKLVPKKVNGSVVYVADLRQSTDYSPFGVTLHGRNLKLAGAENYRKGFNGMEKDDEIKGNGNSYDFGARMLDPRLGRWLTIDALFDKYPFSSPYVFAVNSPLSLIDPDGKDIIIAYKTGEKNEDGSEVVSFYTYGSGLKVPHDKFVRQTVRTLNRIVKKGKDPFGIINAAKNSEELKIAVEKGSWDKSAATFLFSGMTQTMPDGRIVKADIDGVYDVASWTPNGGNVSNDGTGRQSGASGLLHELAHTYYQIMDPEGHIAEFEAIFAINDPEEQAKAFTAYEEKEKRECGKYDNYADAWIIKNVEGAFNEGKRNSHEGYCMKTLGGAFSKFGFKVAKGNCEGTVRDLKTKGSISNDRKNKS